MSYTILHKGFIVDATSCRVGPEGALGSFFLDAIRWLGDKGPDLKSYQASRRRLDWPLLVRGAQYSAIQESAKG